MLTTKPLRLLFLALAGLAATPLLAQATGPQGYAEPRFRGHAAAPVQPAPPREDANIVNFQLSTGGTVSVLLRPDKAPQSVERIKALVGRHFYDGTIFHRVIDGFMAQGGDPKGDGTGGSDLPNLKDEFNDLPHVRGAMAMAHAAGANTANSQFYIMLAPNLELDQKYAIVGRVIAGMAYVDLIEKGEPPQNPSRILRAYMGAPPANAATGPVAAAASSAAAGTAAAQAAQASIAASDAARAAQRGDAATAGERASAAQASAQGAAEAAGDAAEAAKAARKQPPRR